MKTETRSKLCKILEDTYKRGERGDIEAYSVMESIILEEIETLFQEDN